MNVWTIIRLALVVLAAVAPFFLPTESQPFQSITWQFLVVIVVALPLMLLFIVGIQAINPYSAPVWNRPSWSVNPFSTREPLQFFYFAAFVFVASGIGAVARLLALGVGSYVEALLPLVIGFGVLLGVALCMLVYRSKMAKSVVPAA